MTKDERKRLGRRIRALRIEKELTQAELAKRAGVAIGTVQAIEVGSRETRESKVERVAKKLETSVADLLRADGTVTPADPLLTGLNREDLLLARRYHDATTALRQCVSRVLAVEDDEQGNRVLLIERSARFPLERIKVLNQLAHKMETVPEPHVVTTNVVSKRAES